jgi:hypothetical protein
VSSPVSYPASPDSGLTYIPNDPYASVTYGSTSYPSSAIIPVLNNPSISPLSYGSMVSTSGPLGGLSMTEILFGGAGLLTLVLLAGKKR